ncbi:MAG: DUF4372 domain-containing protein [Opitutaceae bacterium]
MKRKPNTQPNRRDAAVLRQICQLIPTHLVAKLARESGADEKSRTFTPWSHVVAMIYAQISHALSLALVDAARAHDNKCARDRGRDRDRRRESGRARRKTRPRPAPPGCPSAAVSLTTRSPSRQPRTALPTPAIRPLNSWPSTTG